jgi:RNA polymerase sigma-70 factor (ECF subfamily)
MTDFRDKANEYGLEANTVGTLTLDGARAKQGWALEKIHRTYQPRVIQWCRETGLSATDSEDASQTVFLRLLTGIQRFTRKGRNQSLGAWLRCIAERKSIDIHRNRVRMRTEYWSNPELAQQTRIESDPISSSPKAPPWPQRVEEAIEIVKSECEPQTWQAFEEVVINGRQPNDVAAQLGVARNVVYLAKSRILRRLRELLA